MADVRAINASNITTIGVGIIIALIVIGVLLSLVITAIIGRVVILVVVIVAAVLVWQQRTHIKDEVSKKACHTNATFFGIHVDAPDDVKQYCANQN